MDLGEKYGITLIVFHIPAGNSTPKMRRRAKEGSWPQSREVALQKLSWTSALWSTAAWLGVTGEKAALPQPEADGGPSREAAAITTHCDNNHTHRLMLQRPQSTFISLPQGSLPLPGLLPPSPGPLGEAKWLSRIWRHLPPSLPCRRALLWAHVLAFGRISYIMFRGCISQLWLP